jgi:hypothetical protein
MRFFFNSIAFFIIFSSCSSALRADEKNEKQPFTQSLDVSESSENAANYFWEKIVLPAQKNEFSYQEVHGDLNKASLIVTIFSSLACPMCAELHLQALPELLNSQAFREGKLAVICRDYPADPLSLHASAAIWALPEKAKEFRERLFEKSAEDVWTRDLKEMRELVLSFCGLEEEKQKITAVMNDSQKTLMKKIFAQRSADKEPLGINEVPLVMIYSVAEKSLVTLKSFWDLIKVLDVVK